MNDITKVAAVPVQVKSVSVSASTQQGASKINGNKLPQAAETANAKPANVADRQIIEEHVQAAVAQMNEYIQSTQRDLHFSYDKQLGQTVVQVLDRKTKEVIRQIPDEIFLRLAQDLDNHESLKLFSAHA